MLPESTELEHVFNVIQSVMSHSGYRKRGDAQAILYRVGKDVYPSHVVCEAWSEGESRWMYIDPDRNMIDFDSDEFITGAEAWQRL